MASPATPVTPVTPAAQKAAESTPTGKWRHPQFDEITRRQYATHFDDRNVRSIVGNGACLVATFAFKSFVTSIPVLRSLLGWIFRASKTYTPWFTYLTILARIILVFNILQASSPLFWRYKKDDIADIPLTPSQRLAMGLDPNVPPTPATPGSTYVTPPRYQKTTPRSSLGGSGESPLSGTGSPRGFGMSTSNSPFSPAGKSPFLHRTASATSGRTPSFNGQSPLSGSFFGDSSSSATPGTPTPGTGRASVGLNSKWLYERGRASSRSSLFS